MVRDAVFLVLAAFAAFLPVLFWGYAFSYLDADRFNARRFALGILTGAAAVFPIAFMSETAQVFPFLGNVFARIAEKSPVSASSAEFAAFAFTVAAVVLLAVFALRAPEVFSDRKPLVRSFLAFALSVPAFAGLAIALPALFSSAGSTEVRIAGASLVGFSAIALSYFVVAAVEEGGKHLGLYGTGDFASFARKWALYAAFVALGFAFAENVLYLSSLIRSDAPFSSFFSTWFSRSVFSVAVHTLCSVAAAGMFAKSAHAGVAAKRALLLTAGGIFLAVALHAAFDVTVSYGKTGIVFLYLVLAYVFLTRAFQGPESAEG